MEPIERKTEADTGQAVADYKRILSEILDRRPSGTRQRLAVALGKNRSFISQISSETYATPIPANHLETIFEICHFSSPERRTFLDAYARAHPRRPAQAVEPQRLKAHTLYLPDLGSDASNSRLHALVTEFIRGVTRIIEETRGKGKFR
jgi:hypothetical protein